MEHVEFYDVAYNEITCVGMKKECVSISCGHACHVMKVASIETCLW